MCFCMESQNGCGSGYLVLKNVDHPVEAPRENAHTQRLRPELRALGETQLNEITRPRDGYSAVDDECEVYPARR